MVAQDGCHACTCACPRDAATQESRGSGAPSALLNWLAHVTRQQGDGGLDTSSWAQQVNRRWSHHRVAIDNRGFHQYLERRAEVILQL